MAAALAAAAPRPAPAPASAWGVNPQAAALPLPLPRRRPSCQAPHVFKVRLHDFACEGLVLDGRCEVYLKVDFGGYKVFRSDAEEGGSDVRWGFKAGFDYATEAATLERLAGQELRVQVLGRADGQLLGEAAVDLETAACGPAYFRLGLRGPDQGAVVGVLSFICVMKMRSPNLTVICTDLALTARGAPAAAGLRVACSLAEAGRPVAPLRLPYSEEGRWQGPFSLTFPAALADLLRAPDLEGLRFAVVDELGVRQGEASVHFRAAFSAAPGAAPLPFRAPVVACADGEEPPEGAAAAGELEGSLLYQNLPSCAQMVGGLCVDGQIEGGWALVEGLPYPRSLPQPPPAWRDPAELVPGDADCCPSAEPGAQMWGDEDGEPGLDARQLSEALEQIELPRPWEQHRERVRTPGGGERWSSSSGGRLYFADPRSRRTTWRDPRFLPPHWEQRVDPQTGRVYFQYHRTRQTTYVDPRGCPLGWDMRLSKNGDIYFAHTPSRQTTFVDPRGLPEHLEAALDRHGRMFFKDHDARATFWEDPRDGQPEDVLARWRREESIRWWRTQVWREIEEIARQRAGDETESQEMDLSG